MDKHAPKEEMIKDLENILAKINALEVTAKDEEAKARETQRDSLTDAIKEINSLKKELFEIKNLLKERK